MGTQRWEKETAERNRHDDAAIAEQQGLLRIDAEKAALKAGIIDLRRELSAKKKETRLLNQLGRKRQKDYAKQQIKVGELRGAD
jgi:hypothetical protein